MWEQILSCMELMEDPRALEQDRWVSQQWIAVFERILCIKKGKVEWNDHRVLKWRWSFSGVRELIGNRELRFSFQHENTGYSSYKTLKIALIWILSTSVWKTLVVLIPQRRK